MSNTDAPTVEPISVFGKLPEFYSSDPDSWFLQAEAVFKAEKISSSTTKCNRILSSLPKDIFRLVSDLVHNPGDNPYESLKKRLCTIYGPSDCERINALIDQTPIGDRKPSVLLQEMQYIAKPAYSLIIETGQHSPDNLAGTRSTVTFNPIPEVATL